MKRIAVLVTALLLALIPAGCERPAQRYQTAYFEVFDTPMTFTAYADSMEEFERFSGIVHGELMRLHRLFDIYNNYKGMNNLKTVNDCAGGEPVAVEMPELDAVKLAEKLWDALNEDNRVSLYVCVGGMEVIINKYGEEA